MGREVVVAYVHELIQHLYGAAAENYKNPTTILNSLFSQRVSTQQIHLQAFSKCKFQGFHVADHSDFHLLDCDTAQFFLRRILTHNRSMQTPTPKVAVESSSETLISTYKTTWCHNPEDQNVVLLNDQ
jgi:hypothetical protein